MSVISSSTASIFAGQDLVKSQIHLDLEFFRNASENDIESVHSRKNGGFVEQPLITSGKENVLKVYDEGFYSCSKNFNLKNVAYKGFGPYVKYELDIDEDKSDGNRYHMNSQFQLNFGNDSKIKKIFEISTKDCIACPTYFPKSDESIMSDSTVSIFEGQEFLKQQLLLNEEYFKNKLLDDAESYHARVEGGFVGETTKLVGKKSILDFYHRKFYAITNNFDLRNVAYNAFGYHVEFDCEVEEDKIDDDGVTRRYHMEVQFQIDYIKNSEGELKIKKIFQKATKDLVAGETPKAYKGQEWG